MAPTSPAQSKLRHELMKGHGADDATRRPDAGHGGPHARRAPGETVAQARQGEAIGADRRRRRLTVLKGARKTAIHDAITRREAAA